jgi:glycosyltransferase involved in cell wall biosynthesis
VLQYLLRSAQKPDFVFFRGPTNLILVALLCKLMRIPFGQELNGVFPYRYAKRRIANPLEVMSDRFFARNSKVVVSVTNELNRLAEAESSPGTILAVAPNGVNTDQIRPCDKGVRDERFDLKVGYLGKCYQRRGHELMIEAISLLRWRDEKHVGFKLVGGGPNAPLLAEQAGRLGVAEQVEFRPGVAPEKMSEEIADCDVLWAYFDDWDRFLLTGMSPLKIWTYLALGKPFILRGPSNVLVQFRDVPGVLWTHETSVAGLAESVAALVHTDRDHLRRLGIQGRRYVERYGTWQLHAERIDAAIREYFRRDIAA